MLRHSAERVLRPPISSVVTAFWLEFGRDAARCGNRRIQTLFRLALKWHYPIAWKNVSPLSAALYSERRSLLEDGTPVAFTASCCRGDAYDFVAALSIGSGER